MAGATIDIDKVRKVLREATGPDGKFSMRSLSRAAGRHRDTVSDILTGRNNNPTMDILNALAGAMGADITIFTESGQKTSIPTTADLELALREVLPGMPQGSVEQCARYLAKVVSKRLGLSSR